MAVFVSRVALGLVLIFFLNGDDLDAYSPVDSDFSCSYWDIFQIRNCSHDDHSICKNLLHCNDATRQDSNVTFLGRWPWGPCWAVAVRGNYAYIGNGALFQALEISDPADPQIIGEILVHGIFDMDISGDYAYLAGNHTLTIIDISTPTTPTVVGNLHISTVHEITVSGDYAYLGDFPGSLHIVDISDPTEPREVGTQIVAGESVEGIAIYQHYAYVSTYDGMVIDIVDVSDPSNPQYEGYYVTGGFGADIAVDGHYLLLGTSVSPQLRILDITDPVNPEYVGDLEISDPRSIKVVDNYAYISHSNGLSVIDVSDVTAPEEVGGVDWTRPNHISPGNLVVDINHVYVASFTGLWVINGSSPKNPFETTFFPTGGSAHKVAITEDIAYVADGYAGLWIVDVTNPVDPQNISHLATEGSLYDIALVGEYAYLLHYAGRYPGSLWIVDICDPSDPSEISQLSVDGNALAISGDHALVTVADSGLVIIDLSDPTNPYRVGFYPLSSHPNDVAVWGNYAYVGTSSNGLRIIDVSDPSSPVEVGSYFEGGITTLAVAENLVYAPYSGKLWVLDVSIPTNPCVVGSTDPLFYQSPTDITVSGDYVYMSLISDHGLQIIDVSYPEDPILVGYWGLGGGRCVTVSGEHIYWGNGGFFILRNDLITWVYEQSDQGVPAVLTLYQNYPNPFNLRTTVEYYLPQDCLVKLTVYNVSGQEVATLVDEFQSRGKHEVDFNANGFSSGVYVYHLEVGDFFQTEKMLLVR